MDPRIGKLKKTTFSGRRPARGQISEIQETVALLPGNAPQRALQDDLPAPRPEVGEGFLQGRHLPGDAGCLERHGILKLPSKREGMVCMVAEKPVRTPASDPQPAMSAPLSDLEPVCLEIAADAEERQLWNALVDRYHYFSCNRPFGETSGGKGEPRKGIYAMPLSESCRVISRGEHPGGEGGEAEDGGGEGPLGPLGQALRRPLAEHRRRGRRSRRPASRPEAT